MLKAVISGRGEGLCIEGVIWSTTKDRINNFTELLDLRQRGVVLLHYVHAVVDTRSEFYSERLHLRIPLAEGGGHPRYHRM